MPIPAAFLQSDFPGFRKIAKEMKLQGVKKNCLISELKKEDNLSGSRNKLDHSFIVAYSTTIFHKTKIKLKSLKNYLNF